MQVKKWKGNERIFLVRKGKKKFVCTQNLLPGFRFSDEPLIQIGKIEYRVWNPYKSKIAAAVLRGIKQVPIEEGDKVLYLGAGAGQTASYVSDIVGERGVVFCIDIAPRIVRELYFVCRRRENMVPILADANKPEQYDWVGECDFVYQDIAQPNQAEIFLKNCSLFLKRGGYGMIAVKARSIDVLKDPREVFRGVKEELSKMVELIDERRLDPYERDHCMFLIKA